VFHVFPFVSTGLNGRSLSTAEAVITI
jgi:hypothetical protein